MTAVLLFVIVQATNEVLQLSSSFQLMAVLSRPAWVALPQSLEPDRFGSVPAIDAALGQADAIDASN